MKEYCIVKNYRNGENMNNKKIETITNLFEGSQIRSMGQ